MTGMSSVIIVRRRAAPIRLILMVGALITALLFVLKVAQIGLAAEWSWVGIFTPLWVPIVLFGVVRLLAYLEANKPRGRA